MTETKHAWHEITVAEDADHIPRFPDALLMNVPEGTYALVPIDQIKMLGRLADLAGLLKSDITPPPWAPNIRCSQGHDHDHMWEADDCDRFALTIKVEAIIKTTTRPHVRPREIADRIIEVIFGEPETEPMSLEEFERKQFKVDPPPEPTRRDRSTEYHPQRRVPCCSYPADHPIHLEPI